MRTVAIAKLKEDMGIDSVEDERQEYITGFGGFSLEKVDNEQPVELLLLLPDGAFPSRLIVFTVPGALI